MLTLHGQMTNLLARAHIHISSFATMQLLVGNHESTLASIFALSTSEAALIAACAQEVFFCRKLANELGFLHMILPYCSKTLMVHLSGSTWSFPTPQQAFGVELEIYQRLY